MSQEPKKIDRRKFIYAGLGAVAVAAIGVAAYFATRPPERVVETVVQTQVQTQVQTVEKERVITQTIEKPVERTIVTTVAGTPTTIVRTETLKETVVQTQTVEVKPTPVEKRAIDYLNIFNVQSAGARLFSKLMVEKFNALHPTHKLNLSFDSYTAIINPELLGKIKAGTQPLLFDTVDHWDGQYIIMDAVLPLDEFLDKHKDIVQDNWCLAFEEKWYKPYQEKYGYKYWALPFCTTYQSFFWVRTDLIGEAGFTLEDVKKINSLDKLKDMALQVNKYWKGKGKTVWGFELCGTRFDITDTIWPQWAIAHDKKLGYWFSEDWSETYLDQWPWVKTLEAHVDFIDSGVSSPAAPRESDEVIAELLMQGSVAMSQSEPINVGVIMDRDKTLRETRQKEYLRSGTIQFVPGADYGSGIRGLVAPLGFAILKRPDATKKDYEAAFEFALSWLTEDAQRDVFEFSGGIPASTKTMDNLLKSARENMAKSPPDYSLQLIDALWPLVKDTTKNVLFPPFPAFVNVAYDIHAGWGEKAWLKQISPQEAMNNAANEVRKLIKDLGFAKK